jgi:dihydroflavonol-4-reductase
MAKYFITGSTGFVGHHLIQKLSSQKNEIFCLYRHKKAPLPNTHAVQWIKGDLLDINTYKDALKETDYVIHLAGLLSARRKEDYFRANVDGTASLLEACREVGATLKRFVHMSSIAVVGPNSSGALLKETDSCSPQTEYGKSKYQAEQVALSYSKTFPVVILRPTVIYGQGDLRGLKFLQSLNNPVSWLWISQIKTICLCHVTDVVKSCLLSVQKDIESGEIFTISDPEVSTWETVWKTLEEILNDFLRQDAFLDNNLTLSFAEIESKLNSIAPDIRRYQFWACDTTKAQRILGFYPEMPFKKGAYDTISWYLGQGLLSKMDINQIWNKNKRK